MSEQSPLVEPLLSRLGSEPFGVVGVDTERLASVHCLAFESWVGWLWSLHLMAPFLAGRPLPTSP